MGTHKPQHERFKEILECRCIHGLTNSETGARIGISSQTVKNHTTTMIRIAKVRNFNQICYFFAKREKDAREL